MIAIVDYGMGNLRSVQNALEFVGASCTITGDTATLLDADKVILPGVGSFRAAMENIERRGLRAPLDRCVHQQGKPFLGICLGMQLLAERGDEDGPSDGLGFLPAEVKRFPFKDPSLPIPHIGFNAVALGGRPLFAGLGDSADFYFVHSFRMECREAGDVVGWCEYGERFAAAVEHGNVVGTQFHPEKSQTNGLRLLANFVARKS
jgi:glutamine amidotransferase